MEQWKNTSAAIRSVFEVFRMSIKKPDPSRWSSDLGTLANVLATAEKSLRTLPTDPFESLKRIDAVAELLKRAGVAPIPALDATRSDIEQDCVRHEAEFWGRFAEECAASGWELFGSTNRRLVNRAIFVSQAGRVVKVEGLSTAYTPFVPKLIAVLVIQLRDVGASEAELQSFLEIVSRAYDSIPRAGQESSLEAIYRHSIIEAQKPNFWRNPSPGSFVTLSRPMFRYRLSEVLRLGITAPGDRALSLGTTTMTKDAWELYSPGEQRVVLAGRLSLTSDGGLHAS